MCNSSLNLSKGSHMKIKHQTLIASLACFTLILACGLFSAPASQPSPVDEPIAPSPKPQSAASNTPRPTEPPQPTDTAEPPTLPPPTDTPSCYKWDQITLDMAGDTVCVYGIAFSHQGQSRIDFSPEKNSFFLIDATYYYPNLSEGACVVAEEELEIFDNKIPFMTINGDLYKCEPWMME